MDSQKLRDALESKFGYKNYLNDLQRTAVENIWDARRDVFVRGFGKSLCYQLPVMIKDNCFIIVISSRVSYMKMQQDFLKSQKIKTNYLTSKTSRKQRLSIEKDIISKKSEMKILYITPVQYESGYFKTLLKKIKGKRLFYIVIDQAENIVSKQENLRKQYQNLELKAIPVPKIAISSPTSLEVQKDIIKKLNLLNPKVYILPVLRTNLYCDTWYTNTLSDPMAHLIEFIQNCLCRGDHNNFEAKESCGLIVCTDLEETISIAKFLTSTGIPALPHYLNENKGCESKNMKNTKGVKVITVCEKFDMLAATNSLVKSISGKAIRFIVYWYTLPSIQKYYFQSSQARCFHGTSYCRIYCQLEDLVNNYPQPWCLEYRASSDFKDSLMRIQCRHKVYCEYFGDVFSPCKNYCDVCSTKEEVKDRISLLLQITDNQILEMLQDELQRFSRDSVSICDKSLQYGRDIDFCRHPSESNYAKSKGKGDNPKLNKNIPSDDVYVHEIGTEQTISCDYQTDANVHDTTIESNNDHLDRSIEYVEENGTQIDIKSQAISALDKAYEKLSQQSASTFTLFLSQYSVRNNAHTNTNDQISNSNVIYANERNSNRFDKKKHKTKKKTIEIITLDDDETVETEEVSSQNKTINRSDGNDGDVIFIEEVKMLKKKRHPSAATSNDKKKLRKLS